MADFTTREKLLVCFPYGHFNWSVLSRDNIYNIVSKAAYHDMTPRHLKGIGKYKNEKEAIFNKVTDALVLYFIQSPKTKEEFDNWHKELCEEVCRDFSALPDIELKFGKAQKLVNISFKHLYCFWDSAERTDYFKYCHIPVDNNVIDWCKKHAGIAKPDISWSNLSFEQYHDFQENVFLWLNSAANKVYRDYDGTPYSALQLDFIAWMSDSNARHGVIDEWRRLRDAKEWWNQYADIVISQFPELVEQVNNQFH